MDLIVIEVEPEVLKEASEACRIILTDSDGNRVYANVVQVD